MADIKSKNKYDLLERTSSLAKNIIDLCKKLPRNEINKTIIFQLVKSATSIGANYTEADCAESKKDFIHKLSISRKEAKETMYWLNILKHAMPEHKNECDVQSRETEELLRIFSTIITKTRNTL